MYIHLFILFRKHLIQWQSHEAEYEIIYEK